MPNFFSDPSQPDTVACPPPNTQPAKELPSPPPGVPSLLAPTVVVELTPPTQEELPSLQREDAVVMGAP